MYSILIFLLILSVLVLIHELGHFLAAIACGVKTQEFGYGFPPRAIGWTRFRGRWKRVGRKDDTDYPRTVWSLNWLPLGGFVRLKGESVDGIDDPDSMHQKPIWQRVIILAAGVTMNWLLAVALLTIVFSSGALTVLEDLPSGAHISDRKVLVTDVLAGSPAAAAGFQTGDVVIRSSSAFTSADGLRNIIHAAGTSTVSLTILRDHAEKTLNVVPAYLPEAQRVAIGVSLSDAGIVSFSVPEAFIQAVRYTATLTVVIVKALGGILRDIVMTRHVSQDVSGPVGIAVMTGQVAQQGINALLYFAAMLSINLAVVNFLPIPALDGGRVLFLIIEKIRRKPMNRELEIKIHNIAFLVLILLILLVTVRDVFHYGPAIIDGVKKMSP